MADSGLEVHLSISDMKATAVVLKCDILWNKRHQEINYIDNRLMKQIYLSWEKNSLEGEFVEHDDEEVQDKDEEEEPERNTASGIG